MQQLVFSPSDFVAILNQTLDYAYPNVTIVGEIANFRISRNKWVYFSLKDDYSSVAFFGTIYTLPGPIEDGLRVAVSGRPHLHEQYGFSVQIGSIQPVGEGSIKKAADLLAAKLEAEGLFALERKRALPFPPQKIGLITSVQSAAYADFIKIVNARYSGLQIDVYDVQVQGEQAVIDVAEAVKYFNEHAEAVDLLVITRGGGSADDLAAFNNEHVVRAVAASRIPTVVAIGHEVDFSLAELAADARASTPSNAAELIVPDKKDLVVQLNNKAEWLRTGLLSQLESSKNWLSSRSDHLSDCIKYELDSRRQSLESQSKLLQVLSPQAALERGYAVVRSSGKVVKRTAEVKVGNKLTIQLSDGTIAAKVE